MTPQSTIIVSTVHSGDHIKCHLTSRLNKILELFLFYLFVYNIYPPFTRKQIVSLCIRRYVRTRLGVAKKYEQILTFLLFFVGDFSIIIFSFAGGNATI